MLAGSFAVNKLSQVLRTSTWHWRQSLHLNPVWCITEKPDIKQILENFWQQLPHFLALTKSLSAENNTATSNVHQSLISKVIYQSCDVTLKSKYICSWRASSRMAFTRWWSPVTLWMLKMFFPPHLLLLQVTQNLYQPHSFFVCYFWDLCTTLQNCKHRVRRTWQ